MKPRPEIEKEKQKSERPGFLIYVEPRVRRVGGGYVRVHNLDRQVRNCCLKLVKDEDFENGFAKSFSTEAEAANFIRAKGFRKYFRCQYCMDGKWVFF